MRERVRAAVRRTEPATAAVAVVAGVGALAVWVLATGLFPHHSLNHDEGVYLQQAAMLLEGQLRLRPPVEGLFRPWFFVVDDGGLYPKYSPVPAAVFAAGKLLGGYRLALVGVGAANLALVAGVVREVFDRWTGVAGAVFVLCSPLFLLDSSVFLPYAPTTLLNLTFAYAYLRADRTGDVRAAAVAGAAVGLAFFARPYTAVLFAAPFVVHALWTLAAGGRAALPRQATTAALGLVGVGVTLGYNAAMTGSPWLFPYEAFAPLDGLGFGRRRILDHEVVYTPELALRANRRVVALFLTEWIAGGPIGSALALAGAASVARRRPDARQLALAGVAVSVVAGNVFFWGNFNILGDLERAGDGLVSVLGPYYHFDLLVPTAAFAAAGALRGARALDGRLRERLDPRAARVALAAVLLVGAAAAGGVTAADFGERAGENAEATATYETAYAPFEGGPPANSLVLVPDPYGDWLNHPFQPLRNDPGFDGRAVYAIDDRPFAASEAFPDRRLYRYVYRGAWAPYEGSPDAARLQRVEDVSGSAVRLDAGLGVPDGALDVTVRASTDEGRAYYVADGASGTVNLSITVTGDRVRVDGDARPTENRTLRVKGRDELRVTVFVDYPGGGGFAYRLDLPVDVDGGEVRALTPRVERCRNPRACGGAAAHVPDAAPPGVFVHTELTAAEPNP